MKNYLPAIHVVLTAGLAATALDFQSICYAAGDVYPPCSINVVADDVKSAVGKLDKLVKGKSGRTDKVSRSASGSSESATIRVSLASADLEDVLDDVRKLGEVASESCEFDASLPRVALVVGFSNGVYQRTESGRVQSSFFAGVAGTMLSLELSNDKSRHMTGVGFTISPSRRWAQLTIVSLKESNKTNNSTGSSDSNADRNRDQGSSMVLLSHNFYSATLGDGFRPYLNPYAGVTYGYSRLFNRSLAAIGGTLGVELIKNKWFTWGLSSDLLGLYSGRDGGNTQTYSTQLLMPF